MVEYSTGLSAPDSNCDETTWAAAAGPTPADPVTGLQLLPRCPFENGWLWRQ